MFTSREHACVNQTLRAVRDCRFRAIFSDTRQPLRLAEAGGRDSEQVWAEEWSRRENNLSPLYGPDGSEGQLIVKSEPFRFPDRLEIFGKGQ